MSIVYLIAPYGGNAKAVSDVLEACGAEVVDTFSHRADLIHNDVASRIQSADAVVVLVDSSSANVLFEAGMAIALAKPAATIVLGEHNLPQALSTRSHLRVKAVDDPLITPFLIRFLDRVRKGAPAPTRSNARSQRPSSAALTALLGQLQELRSAPDPIRVERAVLELLGQVATISLESSSRVGMADQGVDAVISSDALNDSIGNPMLVQVKVGRLSTMDVDKLVRRLEFYLDATASSVALLLYLDPSGARLPPGSTRTPRVIPIDVEDFAHALQTQPFAEVLLSARNAVVHGGA